MANQNTPLGAIQKFQTETSTIHTLLRSPIIGIMCIHLIGAQPKAEIALISKNIYPVENFLTIPKVTIDKEDSFTIASNWLKSLLGKPDITPRSLRPMLPQPLRITPYSTEMFHLLIYAFQGPRPANPDLVWVDLQTANSMCEDGRIIDLVTYFAIKMYILDRPNKS